MEVTLRLVGELTGGDWFTFFRVDQSTGLNLCKLLVATAGIILVSIFHPGIRRMAVQRGSTQA
jgi:uncharacterized membrane protein YeaQ/YmgE (transglycosylase-associated protein family)